MLEKPKIPWLRLLHCYADAVLNTGDYSLAHSNKHCWMQDLIVQGKYMEGVNSFVVALDNLREYDGKRIARGRR